MTDLRPAIFDALAEVIDPEIGRPITTLGMVGGVEVDDDGQVTVTVNLTVAGCPMKTKITADVQAAVGGVAGVSGVAVELGVMTDEQRTALREQLRGPAAVIPFNQPGSLTRVYAVASGKGGVGKSSITANLAAALAQRGLAVGVIDADIYGFSLARMLGVPDLPQQVDGMLLPPLALADEGLPGTVKVVSMGQFVPPGQPILWRGPKLHRALEQFLTDVYWGDLDVLLLDLPPGTGDVALSVAQLLPGAEVLVVTTPQAAAAEVAERAGSLAARTKQQVAGVIENMSGLTLPDGTVLEVFGTGGGEQVAASLSRALEAEVPLLGKVPLDVGLRESGDAGLPVVVAAPTSPAATVLREAAARLAASRPSLAGRSLPVTPL